MWYLFFMANWSIIIVSVKMYILILYNVKSIIKVRGIYFFVFPYTPYCSIFCQRFDSWGAFLGRLQNDIFMKLIAISPYFVHQVWHIIPYTFPHYLEFPFYDFHVSKEIGMWWYNGKIWWGLTTMSRISGSCTFHKVIWGLFEEFQILIGIFVM